VVKSGGVLERLAQCTTLILDKTGTLTVGQPQVTAVIPASPDSLEADETLILAASLDQVSGHVLAAAIVRAAAERGCRLTTPTDVTEVPGQGITGRVGGREVKLGRAGWTGAVETEPWVRVARRRSRLDGALTVFAAVDGRPAGVLLRRSRAIG
jgi:cation transport ATPase